MAAIAYAFTSVATNQTTTSASFVDVPGASIASGNFTAGKKYLLLVTAQTGNSVSNATADFRMVHGSTPTVFSGSEMAWKGDANARWNYGWFTVWTAVSGEDVQLQFSSQSANTTSANFISLLAINLSDDLTENTDWFFADRATNDALATDPSTTDGATVTFTPGAAAHDWLVLSYSSFSIANAGASHAITRLTRSGEAAETVPQARSEWATVAAVPAYLLARVYTLGAASNTFTEQGSDLGVGAEATRLHSSVFTIDLNQFAAHGFTWTEATTNLSATDYATAVQNATITPTVTGDIWYGGYWTFDAQGIGREAEMRLQIPTDTDSPAGQTTANYQFDAGNDAADEAPMVISMLSSMTTGAKQIDLEGSVDSTANTSVARYRTAWAVSMELPADILRAQILL